jgi:phenylpropionate dioxygenase-like ring-hydroxylating dioxygenase large terminal subunit
MGDFGELHRWHKRYPQFGTEPLPIEPCISPEYFALEREKIFRKCWLQVCRVEDVAEPHSFFNRHIEICNTHVLITRGGDGEIRAFHNMCSHRGNKMEWDAKGCSKFHDCKFHGWIYDSSGRLVDVPDEANFFNLDKSSLGLTPIHLDVWQGFVFINLDKEPAQSLREYLGEVADMLDGYPFDQLKLGYAYKSNLKCNWKIAVDSQQEAYHAVHLHRRTLGDIAIDQTNPFMHALDIRFMGPHRMISLPFSGDYKPSPTAAICERFAWTIKKEKDNFLDPNNLPLGVNPARADNWMFDIYLIFPNFWLAPFSGAFQTHNFWPTGVDTMYQEIKMFVRPPKTAGERFALEHAKCLNRDTWLEDFSTLETTQTVLGSGAKSHFILQDEEILMRHFYQMIEDYIGPVGQSAGSAAGSPGAKAGVAA